MCAYVYTSFLDQVNFTEKFNFQVNQKLSEWRIIRREHRGVIYEKRLLKDLVNIYIAM